MVKFPIILLPPFLLHDNAARNASLKNAIYVLVNWRRVSEG